MFSLFLCRFEGGFPIYGEKNYNNNSKSKGVFNEIQRMVGRMVCELHRAFV